MILKQDDIAIFSQLPNSGDSDKIEVTRFHKPTGVYFSAISRTQGFEYLEVGQLNSKGETIDKKTFDGKNQKSFFEAVDYFEELIAKREPQPEQEDPSVGVFIFLKKRDSVAEVFGNKVLIPRKDVEKVFTPPVKKKFGRLNMYAVDNPKYDVIKGKFALNFDEYITNSIAKQLGLTPSEDVFVYKMTPYDTSQDGQSDDTPQDVNDDNLNINDIEGEDPQNMTGDNAEPQDGDGQDGDGQDGDGQDGQNGQGHDVREVLSRNMNSAVDELEEFFGGVDLSSYIRTKGRVARLLNSYSQQEIEENFYGKLNIPKNTPKQEFIKQISDLTDEYLGRK